MNNYGAFKTAAAANKLQEVCHGAAKRAGWWNDLHTGESLIGKRNIPEALMLIVSEVAEAMEGYRKDLPDDKLPHRSMCEVELADAVIRIFDLGGALNYNLGEAIAEKLAYNQERSDHKPEARKLANGKKF